MAKHKKLGKVEDIEHPERWCSEHKVSFSITQGCDQCRAAGICPYYGRACCC